jgi:hypothetical protein
MSDVKYSEDCAWRPDASYRAIELDVSLITGDNREISARVVWEVDDAKADAWGNAVANTLQAAPAMLAMLKELQWFGTGNEWGPSEYVGHMTCIMCGGLQPYEKTVAGLGATVGHKPDCKLAALIAKAEGSAG